MFSPKFSEKKLIQYRDRRKSGRSAPGNHMDIKLVGPDERAFCATVKDVKNHGFSILYPGLPLEAGTEFEFRFGTVSGRARPIWSATVEGLNESACVVIAEQQPGEPGP